VCGIATASISTTDWSKIIAVSKADTVTMRGFKFPRSAGKFCRAYDELRNFLRSRSRARQKVSANYRKFHFFRSTATVLSVLQAA
jgi:hypothetical protein